MRTVMKPIDMIAYHNKQGIPYPVRFKYTEDDDSVVVSIKGVMILEDKRKTYKDGHIVYRVKSVVDDIERVYDILFEQMNLKWYLYKV